MCSLPNHLRHHKNTSQTSEAKTGITGKAARQASRSAHFAERTLVHRRLYRLQEIVASGALQGTTTENCLTTGSAMCFTYQFARLLSI